MVTSYLAILPELILIVWNSSSIRDGINPKVRCFRLLGSIGTR